MPRIVLYTIVLGFFLMFGGAMPAAAQGTNPPALFPNDCPRGVSTGDPTETKIYVDGETSDVPIRDFVSRKMFCPNACFDIRITITRAQSNGKEAMQFKVVGTNKCSDATKSPKDQSAPGRGCSVDANDPRKTPQIQPTVIVDVPKISFSLPVFGEQILLAGQTVGPKSRCKAKDITDTVNSVFDKLGTRSPGTIKTAQNDIDALKNSPNTATPRPDDSPLPNQPQPASTDNPPVTPQPEQPKTQTDAEALQQLLREKYGVGADQARQLVETNPDKVKEMIQKSLSNDPAGATEIAKQLRLNDDVIRNISQMTPPEQMTPEQAAEIARREQQRLNGNTFDPDGQRGGLASQCGINTLAGNFMFAESQCGRINNNPKSSVQGPYHFLCGTWKDYTAATGYGAYSDCAYRNDPDISTKVMNARLSQFADTYGSQCAQAGLSVPSCQYAIHVFGETGFKNVLREYQIRPNDPASVLRGGALKYDAYDNNESIFTRGGTVAGVFGELERRLGGNSTRIGSIQPQVSSPITGFSSGLGSVFGGGGPFTGTGFFNIGNYSNGGPSGYGYQSNPIISFFSGFLSGTTGRPVNTVPNQVPYGTQTQAQAVVSIIAQPETSYVGGNIVVSWSSVGMRADRPCVTRMVQSSTASSTIGLSNEGSIVTSATKKGIIKFAITCTALSGQGIVQTASVSVQ